MGFTHAGVESRSHREAERWLVRLLDAAEDDPRRQEFERWLAANSTNARVYRETAHLWHLGEEAGRLPDVRSAADRALHATPVSIFQSLRTGFAPAVAVAAGLVLFAFLIVYGWNAFAIGQTDIRYATAIGQQRLLRLKDGSTMLLDADSSVVVHYARHERAVDLVHGRAEFRVRHDRHWPFVVYAEGGTVTDLGTTFQVGIGPHGEVRVVLLEGQVSVATARDKTTLTSGQASRFNRSGVIDGPRPADLPAALGWTSGEIVARGWPLPRLLDEMNRYSRVDVDIADATLRDVRVTGAFHEGDQKTLLRVLEAGWPIRARRVSPTKVELVRK